MFSGQKCKLNKESIIQHVMERRKDYSSLGTFDAERPSKIVLRKVEFKPNWVMNACNLSTSEEEAEGKGAQEQP